LHRYQNKELANLAVCIRMKRNNIARGKNGKTATAWRLGSVVPGGRGVGRSLLPPSWFRVSAGSKGFSVSRKPFEMNTCEPPFGSVDSEGDTDAPVEMVWWSWA
jgi:hypothetical protein